ncbi:MAG TPA: small basic family protein [Candidatus Gracilibacteria bacterium]|nr:small basic family protein [Candidatus Gracilibacteria bacterium]
MIYAFLGIAIGLVLGSMSKLAIPLIYAHYTAVVILGMLDAICGAIRSDIVEKHFDKTVFLSGLFFNAALAIGITYLGESLGLNLYLAATVVFTFRIFQNVGATRRVLLDRFIQKKANKK